jgi:hypothetical protein
MIREVGIKNVRNYVETLLGAESRNQAAAVLRISRYPRIDEVDRVLNWTLISRSIHQVSHVTP